MKYKKNILKIIFTILPGVVATFLLAGSTAFSCSWSSDTLKNYFECSFSAPLYCILAIIIFILSVVIAIGIFKNNCFFHYKKIVKVYFTILFVIAVIFSLFTGAVFIESDYIVLFSSLLYILDVSKSKLKNGHEENENNGKNLK
jgi:hypothetical protein